jgi:hypothetical protein
MLKRRPACRTKRIVIEQNRQPTTRTSRSFRQPPNASGPAYHEPSLETQRYYKRPAIIVKNTASAIAVRDGFETSSRSSPPSFETPSFGRRPLAPLTNASLNVPMSTYARSDLFSKIAEADTSSMQTT